MTTEKSDGAPLKRILLVDDELGVLEVVGRFLESEGVGVDKAGDGALGIRRFQEGKFDLVITDRKLAGMDGEEMAAAIKKMSPHTPILLISGQFRGVVNVKPFDYLLSKPFTRDQLLSAVDEMLPEWRSSTS